MRRALLTFCTRTFFYFKSHKFLIHAQHGVVVKQVVLRVKMMKSCGLVEGRATLQGTGFDLRPGNLHWYMSIGPFRWAYCSRFNQGWIGTAKKRSADKLIPLTERGGGEIVQFKMPLRKLASMDEI